jgi:hypothetical protein
MAMFLIAGSFRITGAQPDGDSIRFTPDDPAKWNLRPALIVSSEMPVALLSSGWMPLTRWRLSPTPNGRTM